MTERTCTIDGCAKPTRSKSATWCKMHYHRWYRHGDPTAQSSRSGITASHGRRYLTAYRPDHPIAPVSGHVYQHRVVLYDTIGDGPHPCHWCGVLVDWLPKGERNALQVDHLNTFGDDNRPENLVAACGPCNTTRGSQARSEALRGAG